MKEKTIVTFGCSWTAGDELERNDEGDYVYESYRGSCRRRSA